MIQTPKHKIGDIVVYLHEKRGKNITVYQGIVRSATLLDKGWLYFIDNGGTDNISTREEDIYYNLSTTK